MRSQSPLELLDCLLTSRENSFRFTLRHSLFLPTIGGLVVLPISMCFTSARTEPATWTYWHWS